MASYKTVLAAGCFDPFHVGHVWHLKAARAMGKILVVAVTKDRSVGKGPGRPVFTELERAEMVEPYCDSWILVDDSLEALQKVDPDVFVKGHDYRGKIEKPHLEYCRARGIAIAFTKTKKYSSTALLNHYVNQKPKKPSCMHQSLSCYLNGVTVCNQCGEKLTTTHDRSLQS